MLTTVATGEDDPRYSRRRGAGASAENSGYGKPKGIGICIRRCANFSCQISKARRETKAGPLYSGHINFLSIMYFPATFAYMLSRFILRYSYFETKLVVFYP